MKSIIALVLLVACAAQVHSRCVYPSTCLDQNVVKLYDADGQYYPYESGCGSVRNYYHPTVVRNCHRGGRCHCGTCSSCRGGAFPYAAQFPFYHNYAY